MEVYQIDIFPLIQIIKKDILWYVIYMDKFLPEKINNNIVIFKTEKL